jgi:hypothetical protein
LDWGDTHGEPFYPRFITSGPNPSLFAISPGRFFAVNEIKVLLAHIVTTYDIKFEEGKGAPREFSLSGMRFPREANVMFRARQK